MEIVGDRGPNSQATACDMDQKRNVIFYTQLSKNGVGCWKVGAAFCEENTPLVISDCNLLEFPNDLKVDPEGNLWILSDRQSRFLYDAMDFEQFNFRILTAPVAKVIEGSTCEKPVKPGSAKSKPKDDKQKGGFFKRNKSAGEVTRRTN
ncbi:hypothetical protein MSG28_011111 [Choristoneura fumiferana]|uniref:Uncharacterized protein n=1 Tax=Choristoneura fumiferana TaxID=7141 RepID=A0ACC0KR01_CHOFU|nr:hypothetical protein MSG28_011111 [Choristoneura fumiferana]